MKKGFMALACLLAIVATGVQAQDRHTIRIAADLPYKPFEYKKPDGKWTGFEIDLARAACKQMKAKCEFIEQSWDGIIPGLLARKYDVIMSSMSVTPARAKRVLFSEPYYNIPSAWFGPKTLNIDPTKRSEMKGKVVGAQRGTIQARYIADHFGDSVKLRLYTSADDLVLDLENHRLDMALVGYPVGQQTILKNKQFHVVGGLFKLSTGVSAAFRKNDKRLCKKFNKALAKLKSDGTYDRIMHKYFSYDIKM